MMTFRQTINRKTPSYTRSRGVILIVSLMLLLIMTLVGIAAIDSSTLQSQMTRNSLFAQNLYQIARSEIEGQYEKLKGLKYLESVMTSTKKIKDHPGFTLKDKDVETHNSKDIYQQTATLTFTGDAAPPSGYSLGLFIGKNFEVNSVAEVKDTGSISDQTQGLNYPAPL